MDCSDDIQDAQPLPFDGAAAAARYRLNAQQKLFADGLLAGLTQHEAARQAGYAPNSSPDALRAAASTVANRKRVKKYLADARAAGADTRQDDLTAAQRHALLVEAARSDHGPTRLRALDKLEAKAKQREERDTSLRGTLNLLDKLAEIGELGTCLALAYAAKYGAPWRPKRAPEYAPDQPPLTRDQLATAVYWDNSDRRPPDYKGGPRPPLSEGEIERRRQFHLVNERPVDADLVDFAGHPSEYLTPADQRRTEFHHRLQTNPLAGQTSSASPVVQPEHRPPGGPFNE
jgi:hypothetical protein